MNGLNYLRTLTLTFILAGLGSCSNWKSQPVYPTPSQAIAQAIDESKDTPGFAETEFIPQDWWNLFNDPQLTDFVTQALAQSPSIETARAQIRSAAATADRVRAALFPNLTWNADGSRQKLSETGVIPFGNTAPGTQTAAPVIAVPVTPNSAIPVYFSLYETELNLTYDFDFWGKNRNTFRAALGDVQSNIAEEAFARLQLSYSVAQSYFNLQTYYKRQKVLKALVHQRTQYRDMVQQRMNANVDNALSLQNAEFNLADAKDLLLQVQGNIAVTENQLKALIAGDFTDTIQDTQILDQPLPNVPIPTDLPLHLISRRPDITAQLWVIESAGRQIDVAKAGFYPDFNLSAFYGYQTIHFRELFKWPSAFYNADAAVSLPIFDGGRLRANLYSSEVNYDLAIIKYNDLVINAAHEVLDGFALLSNYMKQWRVFKEKSDVQEKLFKLTGLRVQHNIDTALDRLLSEGAFLLSQDQEIIAEGNTIQAMLSLIKALGGGYDMTPCNEG